MHKFVYLVLLVWLSACSMSFGQGAAGVSNAIGASPTASYQVSNIDNVNPVNGNVFLDIPILSYPQRGHALRLSFHVYYNDKQWFLMNWPVDWYAPGVTLGPPPPAPFWSWVANTTVPSNPNNLGAYVSRDQHLDFGRDDLHSGESQTTGSGGWYIATDIYSLFVREANGAKHYYGDVENRGCSQYATGTCPTYVGYAGVQYPANDGSGYITSPTNTLIVTGPDGTVYNADETTGYETISDTVGNSISQNASGWTDTVGRQIPGSLSGPGTATGSQPGDHGWIQSQEPIPGVPAPVPAACPNASSARMWTVPALGGSTQTYYLCYSTVSFQTAFNLDQVLNTTRYAKIPESSGQATMLTQFVLPNSQSYAFTYDPYLSLSTMTLPTGAIISYTWQNVIPLSTDGDVRPLTRALKTRVVNPGGGQPNRISQYYWNSAATDGYWGVITDALGNDVERLLGPQGAASMAVYAGCSPHDVAPDRICNATSSQLLRRDDYTLTYTGSLASIGPGTISGQAVQSQYEPTTITTTVPSSTGSIVSQVVKTMVPAYANCTSSGIPTSDYQSQVQTYSISNCNRMNQMQSVAAYDYGGVGSGLPGALLSTTTTNFNYQSSASYLNANLMSLPSSVVVTGAAETDYGYDENNGSPQGVFGNLTSTTRVNGSASPKTGTIYNAQGMPTLLTDANGNQTSLSVYECSGLFPTQQTAAYQSTTTTQETTGFSHDCTTGKVLKTTDQNGVITQYSYTDPLNRLTLIDRAEGTSAETETGYSYPSMSQVNVAQDKVAKGDGLLTSSSTYDGLGDIVHATSPDGSTVDTTYDSMGRIASVSNPHGSSSSTTDGITGYSYDALGRMLTQTQPDNSTHQWHYTRNATTFTNESGSSWLDTFDGLGRLTSVSEPNLDVHSYTVCGPQGCTSTPAFGSATAYQYDALNNLTSVSQSGNSGDSPRTRSFTYDSLFRLTASYNPETGSTCYGQRQIQLLTSSASTNPQYSGPITVPNPCVNGYDGNGNLLKRTDSRGQTISYTYDALNRMLSKNQSGVLAASYYYDGSVAPGAPSSLLGIVPSDIGKLSFTRTYLSQTYGLTGAQPYDDQYFGYDPLGRLKHWTDGPPSEWGYAAHSIDAIYDLAGNMTGLTYPDGQSITQTIDGAGRLSGVFAGTSNSGPAYVSSIAYLPDGSPNVVSYGNGVTETLTQNNRRQPCESMVAGNGLTLIHRQYFYGSSNAPGQQCNPASANNGNIQSIGDAINAPHSQAFSYDALNRIQSWDTSSFAGALRHQSFNYDSFGNINQTNGYPPAVGTPDPLTFPSAYNASAWPYDANNHLLPSAFGCLPLGVSGTPGQVSGYDADGNTLCSGQFGGSAQAYVWDPESRLSQLWGEHNNNNYGLEAVYSYDAQGNRIRSDQMIPGSGSGTYVTSTFREYSFFGGQMLAEKDQTGVWTDYVYANGKKIVKLPGTDNRIHSHGVFSKSGNELRWNLPQPLNANNTPYLVKTNDRLCLRQYQSNGLGGPVAFFSDNTSTAWNWSDTSGQTMNQLTTQNRWVYRCADLSMSGARTGTSVWIDLLTDVETPAGTWDIWYADMSITSTDGTVTQLIGSQPPTPVYGDFQGNGNAWTVTPVAYPESVVPGSDPTGAASAGVTGSYYLADHLGTTQMEFASGGWPVWKGEFAPFGQELDTQTTQNRYKFTGKERDAESGLDYFGARYYASNMGRFTSPDYNKSEDDPEPVPYANLANPQSLNLYTYAGNNPLIHIDADGHCWPQWLCNFVTEVKNEVLHGEFTTDTAGAKIHQLVREDAQNRANSQYMEQLKSHPPEIRYGVVFTPFTMQFMGALGRPLFIPGNWNVTDPGRGRREGLKFQDPNNPHNNVRIMKGDPNSSNPGQRGDYMVVRKNGATLDANGNPSNDPLDFHIPVGKDLPPDIFEPLP